MSNDPELIYEIKCPCGCTYAWLTALTFEEGFDGFVGMRENGEIIHASTIIDLIKQGLQLHDSESGAQAEATRLILAYQEHVQATPPIDFAKEVQ